MTDPFARVDEAPDPAFYAFERKVTHLAPGAIEALRSWYDGLLPAGAEVLDLMSSWRSHLPAGGGRFRRVVGLGMNDAEMADNPQLSARVVHDLNARPALPFDDDSFDAAVCTVSVQYLTSPIEVFGEVRRVLRPGGRFAVAFSNRCFPTKAVAVWRSGTDADHVDLVRAYLTGAGFTDVVDDRLPSIDDPVFVVAGTA
ncbi:MAG TPA: class I SAM-dependent methyltransferase [Acidimicrobiales bacterium]|nr:class I SAM-dependent methyltransferase [Acidimicrobiales bacterium]